MVPDWDPLTDKLLQVIDVDVLGKKPLICHKQRHDSDMIEIETLIRRAARATELGIPATEMAEAFAREGVTSEMAFLAIIAGRIAATDWISQIDAIQ
jgi:hypothetical protein